MNFTLCQDCKGILQVTWTGQKTHPTCQQTAEELQLRAFVDAVQRGDDAEANRLEAEVNQPQPIPALGSVALWYAENGWPVFPLQPGRKEPATRNGFKDATTDIDQIKQWWGRDSDYNIGLPTGESFDVIDVDGELGMTSFVNLPEGAVPDVHGKVSTPRGFHLYVLPEGKGNRAGVRPGIDFRGAGGYVVAPPSRVDFKRYSWVMNPSPEIMKR